MSDKRPLLLFSGGLDSTYMLYTALQETDVDVLYIDGGQGPDKIKAEELARKAICNWLYDDMPVPDGKRLHRIIRKLSMDSVNFALAPDMTSKQAPSWLVAALYHFNHEVHSEVQIAYVMGDDALIYRHEMTAAWDNLCTLCKGGHAPLSFPLMQMRKESILKYMPVQLTELIWVCELPYWEGMTITPCGKCRACKRHQREMLERFGTMKRFKDRVKEAKKTSGLTKRDTPHIGHSDDDIQIDDSLVKEVHGGSDSSVESQPKLPEGQDHVTPESVGLLGEGTGTQCPGER